MSIKMFPLFTVRSWDDRPCGHQHQHESAAENCAMNMSRKSKGKRFTVLKWSGKNNETPETINHFETRLA